MKKNTFLHLVHMKHIFQVIQLFALIFLSLNSFAQPRAKRAAPKEVTPVVWHQIRYTAPTDNMGHIVAIDISTDKILWTKKVYTINFNKQLEQDVQAVFIDSIYLKKGKLYIRNERKQTYTLDIKTHEVKRIFHVL